MLKGIHTQKSLRTFIINREMGIQMCHRQMRQGKQRIFYIVQKMCSFESLIDSEGAVSRNQGLHGRVQRPGCVKPAHCVTQQESERHSLVKATG